MSTLNQLDCSKCEGWGCKTCRPPAGEQEDVDLRELDGAVKAAVKEERTAIRTLVRNRLEWMHERHEANEHDAAEFELLALDAEIEARSKA